MSEVPERCPTCSTQIPSGATRCPGCARVFGEDNRCPHCHAVAAVRQSGGRYVCVACNKPREIKKGTVVTGGGGDGQPFSGALEPASGAQMQLAAGRSAGFALRAFGVFSMAAGVLGAGAALALFPITAPVVLLAAAVGAGGVGVGAVSMRAGGKADKAAVERARRNAELAIIKLAEERGGTLTVTDVASELRMESTHAEALLTHLAADGSRVGVEVSADGVVLFRFLEVIATRGPRVRVAAGDDLEARFEELEARQEAAAPTTAEHEGS